MDNNLDKKISFCITCMNRLNHIQETLKQNIEDNLLENDVEFILLDYNSTDNLEEWVHDELQIYLDSKILIYYKTFNPKYYKRSHSRNLAFRLAKGEILCNLDADNFLGKGFAIKMIKEFALKKDIFFTSNCFSNDIFGRVVVRRKDFFSINGYNESLTGYGYEDVDLYQRLINYGLTQEIFYETTFSNYISHSKLERISNEKFYKNLKHVYISYINPTKSEILILLNDQSYIRGILKDYDRLNKLNNMQSFNQPFFTDFKRITLDTKIVEGNWFDCNDDIHLTIMNKKNNILKKEFDYLANKNKKFYEIEDQDLIIDIILILTTAINYFNCNNEINTEKTINHNGFGNGLVYSNFDYSKPIILL